jgi:hypothetical protein
MSWKFLILPMILLPLGAYAALANWINRTTLEVSKERIVVRHQPMPWFGNMTLLSEVLGQVYVTRKAHIGEMPYSFDVCALIKNGRRRKLMSQLGEDAAFQLEERIEDFLDIDDEEVSEFSAPRFNQYF